MNTMGFPQDPQMLGNFFKMQLVLLYTTPLAPLIYLFFDWMLT
jgi:hypothetical protein